MNLKVKEYRQAKPVVEGGKEVLVIPVHDHKTQGKGPANVSCEGEDIKRQKLGGGLRVRLGVLHL